VQNNNVKKRKLTFFAIYLNLVLDNLAWALIVPVFAPLFLDSGLFLSTTSQQDRTIMLGFFLGIYSIGQFLGAPLLGEYADRKGRKKSLLLTMTMTFYGYVFLAWGIKESNLYLIFLGRIISGLFAANLSICLASIADLSLENISKSKNFGYLSLIVGVTFIVGSFLGGNLSDSSISKFFNPALPFWIASIICLINIVVISAFFIETAVPDKKVKYNFLKSFDEIARSLKTERIKKLLLIYFFFYLSWNFLFQIGPVLMIEKFQFTYSSIGNLAAFMGLCWALGSGFLHKFLIARFLKHKILLVCFILFVFLYPLIGKVDLLWFVVLLIAVCAVIGGLVWPICNSLVSDKASDGMQGRTLGINQSMQSIANAIAPIFGTYAAGISLSLPFIIASLFSIICLIIYWKESL
jgi:MFS transporter, DHA1 family, tetracycline resistance protein